MSKREQPSHRSDQTDQSDRSDRFNASQIQLALVLVALAALIAVPFLLRPKQQFLTKADYTLVIISPHNEAVRHEFTAAFGRYYKAKTGRSVRIDWRLPGGTSEISRYIAGEYMASFERLWRSSGHLWTAETAGAFDSPQVTPDEDPSTDAPAQAARRAFLNSNTGIGIDLVFGGGAYDFELQAAAGRLVPSDVIQNHPDWEIPQNVSGETFYDRKGRWIGACLASFGICYNTDSLKRLGIKSTPTAWSDIGDPAYFKQVALADPNKSGSVAKTFEMIIQQQMQEVVREGNSKATPSPTTTSPTEREQLAQGWIRGLQIIQAASANARYFTDSAPKIPLDVSQGDAAIGMCIDFYGRFQSEAVKPPEAPSRLQFFTPRGGSSVGVDPIGLLRGAPHREIAEEFIAFVLSLDGQKLWNFKVATPGGPERYALRRLPIRKELYQPEFAAMRSDPGVMPYEEAKQFSYHPTWTAPLFRVVSFIVRVTCLDLSKEQTAAWEALIQAGFPSEATRKFSDLSAVSYDVALNRIKPVISSRNRIEEVRLAKELSDHFREQYREAARLANEAVHSAPQKPQGESSPH